MTREKTGWALPYTDMHATSSRDATDYRPRHLKVRLLGLVLGCLSLSSACADTTALGDLDGGAGADAQRPRGEYDECGNGMDDDGDGLIDEDCFCGTGETQSCFSGGYPNRAIGICSDGVQACQIEGSTEFGRWGACEGDTTPAVEICGDGIDNDCDAAVDEGCECTEGDTWDCGLDFGIAPCQQGTQVCLADGTRSECQGAIGPSAEVCEDGVDNDCDGSADEGCDCIAVPEVCGDAFDNDCDGETDEPACDEGDDPPLSCAEAGGLEEGILRMSQVFRGSDDRLNDATYQPVLVSSDSGFGSLYLDSEQQGSGRSPGLSFRNIAQDGTLSTPVPLREGLEGGGIGGSTNFGLVWTGSEYIVAYQGSAVFTFHNGSTKNRPHGIYVRRLAADGTPLGPFQTVYDDWTCAFTGLDMVWTGDELVLTFAFSADEWEVFPTQLAIAALRSDLSVRMAPQVIVDDADGLSSSDLGFDGSNLGVLYADHSNNRYLHLAEFDLNAQSLGVSRQLGIMLPPHPATAPEDLHNHKGVQLEHALGGWVAVWGSRGGAERCIRWQTIQGAALGPIEDIGVCACPGGDTFCRQYDSFMHFDAAANPDGSEFAVLYEGRLHRFSAGGAEGASVVDPTFQGAFEVPWESLTDKSVAYDDAGRIATGWSRGNAATTGGTEAQVRMYCF